jgi:hypothetical protein
MKNYEHFERLTFEDKVISIKAQSKVAYDDFLKAKEASKVIRTDSNQGAHLREAARHLALYEVLSDWLWENVTKKELKLN